MKTGQRLIMATLTLCLLAIFSASVKADPLTLSLTNPNQAGTAGNILTFAGSLTNVGAPAVQVISSQITFNDGGGFLVLDDSPFAINFLFQTLDPGETLGPLDMFTVEILGGAAPGTYTGVFSVVYNNGTGDFETNLVTFSVTIPQGAAVPEPASLLLLGSGLLGLTQLVRARRKKISTDIK